jgi:3-hydroxyacyl-CoA dehydrogenase
MNEYRIAVIGAGTIGSDVALDYALHGHSVWLKDVTAEKLEAATANRIR